MRLSSASCVMIALSLAFPAYGQTNVNAGDDLVSGYLSKGNYDLNLLGDVSWNTAFTYAATNANNLKINGNGHKITFGPSTGIYFNFYRNNGSLAINDAVVETQTFASERYSLFYIASSGITTNFDFNGTTFQNIGPTNFNLYGSANYGPIISQRLNSVTNIDGGSKGVVFKGNHGLADQSGTIGVSSGTMNFLNNVTFDSNWSANYSGALAIYPDAAPTVNFNGTTLFNNNHAGHYGGAIDMWGGNGTLVFNGDSTFTDNYTYSINGNTADFPNHVTDRSASGGAIHMGFIASSGTTGTSITFNGDTVFDGNFVNDLKTTTYNNAQGGAIGLNQSREGGNRNYNLYMNGNSVFNNNYVYSLNGSGYGGAIFLNAQTGSVNIAGSAEFTNNSAKTLGGAVYVRKGSLNINANKGDIVFQGNRQSTTFVAENRTLQETGNSYTFYNPVAGTGTPNSIYWETANTLTLNGTAGNAVRFYDPLGIASGASLTLNQSGTGEVAFYGDKGVSTAYDTDINVNTTVNGGTFTVADGVNYGRTTFGTFDLKNGATLKGENSGTLKAASVILENGSGLALEGGTLSLDSASIALGNAANGTVNLSGYGTLKSSSVLKANNAGTSLNANVGLDGSGNPEELRLESQVSGTAKLVKNGTGTLLLPTVQAYTDGTIVNAGTLVLTENGSLGSGSATVNANGTLQIDSPASGNYSFSNALLGSGLLKVGLASGTNTFDFASSAGTAFAGTVELNDSTFNLSGTNTAALGNSTLQLNTGSTTNVGNGAQNVGNLDMNGGTLRFPNLPTGVIGTGTLNLGSGTVQVNADTTAISAKNLLVQDDGNTDQLLVGATAVQGSASNLVLEDLSGSASGSVQSNVEQGGNTVAVGTYAYGLKSVSNVPGSNGLYTSYRLTQLDLQNGQTLTFSGDATTPAGANDMKAKITGSGNLAINATDKIILVNANNDYTGNTTVNTGTLQLGTDHALGNTNLLSIAAGATTDINGKTQTIGQLGGAGSLNVNGGNLDIKNGGAFSGVISGTTGALTLDAGLLTLTGANTYTGTTTVTSGTLQIGNGGTTGSYAGNFANSGTVAFNRSDNSGYGGVVSGSGNLVKSGAGTLTLTGNNTYTGGTQINAGTLQIGNGGTVGSITGNVTNNGKLTFNRSDDITYGGIISGTGSLDKSGTGVLTLTSENAYSGNSVVNKGTLALKDKNAAGTGTISLGDDTKLQLGFDNGVFDNSLFGVASSTVSVLGSNITLDANNTVFSGTWDITGSANIDSQNNLGRGSVALGGTLNLNAKSGNYAFSNALSGAGTMNVTMATAADTFSFGSAADNGFAGTLALNNSQFALSGANTQVLTKASLQLNAGNVTTVGTGVQNIGNLALNGGSLSWNGFTTPLQSPNGTISTNDLDLQSGQIRVDLSTSGVSNPPASGGVNLLRQDDGAVASQLIASKTITGDIGNIQLADLNGNALVQDQVLGINEGGSKVADASYHYGLSTGQGNDGVYLDYQLTQLDILSGKTLTLSGDATTPAGANDMKAKITGSGNLAINATNKIILANANNDYTGNTSVGSGILQLGTDHALGNTSLLSIAAGATTDINGKTQTVGALGGAGSLVMNSGNLTVSNGGTFSGVISGNAGTLGVNGGNLTLTGANTYTGTTNVASGTLQIGNGGTSGLYAGNIVDNGSVVFNRSDDIAYGGVISGSGTLNKQGNGTLTLTGSNTYAGGTTITAGTLQVGNGGTTGSITGNITDNGKLVFNRSDNIAYAAVISGSGSLDKDGNGTLTLTGNNGYSGNTNVNAGTLALNQENAAGTGSVSLANSTALQLAFNNGTFDNVIAGGVGSTVSVLGNNITLDADNSAFAGGWNITGSANISTPDNLGTGGVSLGGTLNVNALAGNYGFGNALSGNGTMNVTMASAADAFSFADTANNGFSGTLALNKSRFDLSGVNTQVLSGAALQLNTGNVTTVGDGEQSIGKLTLNGGSLEWDGFTTPEEKPNGTISTNNLALNGGQIRVDMATGGITNPPASGGANLLTQDDGGVLSQLIASKNISGNISNIQLADLNGNTLATSQVVGINENGDKVADASYSYGLSTGQSNDGVYLNYSLSQLDILSGKTLTLSGDETTPAGANDMKAKITGSGNLAINATNKIILANTNNDYSGNTTVNTGTLQLGTDHSLGNTSLLSIAAGATTDMNGKTQTVGALGGAGSLVMNSGNLNLSNGGTFSGIISGSAGALTLGAGNLTLTGANTYTGTTTVSAGTLQIGNGGTSGSYEGNIIDNGTVAFNRSDDIAYGGVISGNGTLNKQGNGKLTLTGNNTYAGGTTVTAGALQIGNGGTTGSITGNIANAGEVIFNRSNDTSFAGVISGTGSLDKEGSGKLTLTGDNAYSGGTNVNAGILALDHENAVGTGNVILANSTALQLAFDNGTLGNAVAGAAGTTVSVLGNGITLGADNSAFAGVWNIAGSANVVTPDNLGAGSVALGGVLNVNAQAGNYTFNNALSGSGTMNVTMATANDVFSFGSSANNEFAGTLVLNNSQFALSGINTKVLTNDTLQLNAGNVTMVGNGTQNIGNLNLNGGSLEWDGFTTPEENPNGMVSTNGLALNGGQIRVDIPTGGIANPPPAGGNNLLTQDDGDVLSQLIASKNITGDISNIQLADLNGNALSANQVLGINENGVKVADASYNYGLSTGHANDGVYLSYGLTQLDIVSGQTLTLSGDATTPDGANDMKAKITGSGNLAINATDRIIIANTNNDYSGSTTVNTGTLQLGTDHALGNTSLLDIVAGATADINGKMQTIGALGGDGSLDINGGKLDISNGGTFGGNISGNAGTLDVNGGSLILTGNNTYTGTTHVTSGTLQIGNGGTSGSYAGSITNEGSVIFDRSDDIAYGGVVSGSGNLVKDGNGTLTLTGVNSYTGGTSINSGTLQVGDGGTSGVIIGDVANEGELVFNRSDNLAFGGVISGNGSMSKEGNGVLTLTGDNTYTGTTSVNSGTLQIGNGGTSGAVAGDIVNAGSVVFNRSDDTTYAGAISGTGQVEQAGSGTTTLTGNNTYDGGTLVSDGTVRLTGAGTVGSGTVNIASQGTLLIDNPNGNAYTFGNLLEGSGQLKVAMGAPSDTFDFAASAGNSFGGKLNLNSGSMTMGDTNSSALSQATLELGPNGSITMDGERTIGNLTFAGGTMNTTLKNGTDVDVLNVGYLDVNSNDTPAVPGTVNYIGGGSLNPEPERSGNLLLQGDINANNSIAIVKADAVSSVGTQLTLLIDGVAPADKTVTADDGFGNTDLRATYGYMAVVTDKKADNMTGLFGGYVLKTLESQTNAVLDSETAPDAKFGAQLTGVGNFEFRAHDNSITLMNSTNDYTGQTTAASGALNMGANNVFGQTSALNVKDGATVNMNGFRQTVGELNGDSGSALNLGGGALTVTAGGNSNGSLSGSGNLHLTGGTLAIANDNTNLSAAVDIQNGATAKLQTVGGLGSGDIALAGTLQMAGAQGTLENRLNGNGTVSLTDGSNLNLAADNTAFSGNVSIGSGTTLTASATSQLGTAALANNGNLVLKSDADWTFTNAMSGSGKLVKEGSGIIHIGSEYAHSGGTEIRNGVLVMDNTASALSGTGDVKIASGATLGGYGSIGGNVVNLGTLSPGNGLPFVTGDVGTMTIAGNLTNSGMVNLGDGSSAGNVLRVQGNFAGGGTLAFNTVLGDDNSKTDKLVVEGNTSGSTAVLVNNVGGVGADTHNGIQIVQVDGLSDGNFYLGSRVVQGAYDYGLYKGSIDSPDDGDWYLRSTRNDPSAPIRPEIGAYLANRDAAQTMFRYTLHDRMGNAQFTEGQVASRNAPAFWSVVQADYGTGRAAGQIDQRRWGNKVQVGGDIFRSAEDINNWRVGAMAGYGTNRSRSLTDGQAYRADSDLTGYNAGVYATWFADGKAGADGPYLDGWIQHAWFRNKVKGDELAAESYNSRAWSGSIEGGWTFNAYSGKDFRFYIQPQVQVVYTRYHAADIVETNGTVIESGNKNGVSTRLGARLFGNSTGAGSKWQPYAELNWLHNQKDSTIRIDDQSFDSALPKDVAELKAGFEVAISKNTNAWAQVQVQKGDDHYKSVGGLAGIRVSW